MCVCVLMRACDFMAPSLRDAIMAKLSRLPAAMKLVNQLLQGGGYVALGGHTESDQPPVSLFCLSAPAGRLLALHVASHAPSMSHVLFTAATCP